MADTKKVRILENVGDPLRGVIIRSGAVADLPTFWADRYIAEGRAEEIAPKAKDEKVPKSRKAK